MDPIQNTHRRMAVIALLVGLGVVLHRLEALLPLPTPWVKLGLANIMALIALVFLGFSRGVGSHPVARSPGIGPRRNIPQPHFFPESGRGAGFGVCHGASLPANT